MFTRDEVDGIDTVVALLRAAQVLIASGYTVDLTLKNEKNVRVGRVAPEGFLIIDVTTNYPVSPRLDGQWWFTDEGYIDQVL